MIKPTLENPHAIVEEASEAKEGDTTEKASSYIFIRSFKKADGSRFYYFTSITVSKDGREVVVSSQENSKNGEYWTINSAGIFRKKYSRNKRKVYDRPAIGSDTNTDISGVDSGHNNGVTTPAGNSPQTSESKVTDKSSSEQKMQEKMLSVALMS